MALDYDFEYGKFLVSHISTKEQLVKFSSNLLFCSSLAQIKDKLGVFDGSPILWEPNG